MIYEQCHKSLQSKLKARENYNIEIKGNPIVMLKAIQEHTMSYQENIYDAKIVVDTLRNLLYTKQRDDKDLVDYTRRFKATCDFYEAQQGEKMMCVKMAKADDE
jgi:aminopeptidase-like protein